MAEERKLSVSEVRKTVSTSMGAAFGFVIGLLWSNVVLGAIATAGIEMTPTGGWGGWAIFLVIAIVMTVIMIVLIIVISRWGNKA
jgi:uncharacterized protein YacL